MGLHDYRMRMTDLHTADWCFRHGYDWMGYRVAYGAHSRVSPDRVWRSKGLWWADGVTVRADGGAGYVRSWGLSERGARRRLGSAGVRRRAGDARFVTN